MPPVKAFSVSGPPNDGQGRLSRRKRLGQDADRRPAACDDQPLVIGPSVETADASREEAGCLPRVSAVY